MEALPKVAAIDGDGRAVAGDSDRGVGCKRPRAAEWEMDGVKQTAPSVVAVCHEAASRPAVTLAERTGVDHGAPPSFTSRGDNGKARGDGTRTSAMVQATAKSSLPTLTATRQQDGEEGHAPLPTSPSTLATPTPACTPTPPATRLPRKTPLSMSSPTAAGRLATATPQFPHCGNRQTAERDGPAPGGACVFPAHSNTAVRSPASATASAPTGPRSSPSEDGAKVLTLSDDQHSSLPSTARSSPASVPPTATVEAVCASAAATLAHQRQLRRVQNWAEVLCRVMMQDRASDEAVAVKELCSRVAAAIPGDAQTAKDTFLMLLVHLKDPENTTLRRRLINGELPVEVLVTMGEHELVNPRRRQKLEAEFEERARDRNLTEIEKAMQTSSSLFPCPVCKARDCTWTQKQTRSADEPMTVFCTCNKCHHMWKRY